MEYVARNSLIREFFKVHEVGSAKRRVEQTLDMIIVRTWRLGRDRTVMEKWCEGR